MNTLALQTLVEKLPNNYLKVLNTRTDFSRNYIWQVLHGERYNQAILNAALTLAQEHQTGISSLKKEINSL
jgi:hypothetical protein